MSGSLTSTKQFLWEKNVLREERDGSGNFVKAFFASGERVGSTSYYYTKDHLGSIRNVCDASGVIQSAYQYDFFGRRSVQTESVPATFSFAALYLHSRSGLSLTSARTYSSALGRWLSRDWINEQSSTNLYNYCGNSPLMFSDPSGLVPLTAADFPGGGEYLFTFPGKAGGEYFLGRGLFNAGYNHIVSKHGPIATAGPGEGVFSYEAFSVLTDLLKATILAPMKSKFVAGVGYSYWTEFSAAQIKQFCPLCDQNCSPIGYEGPNRDHLYGVFVFANVNKVIITAYPTRNSPF